MLRRGQRAVVRGQRSVLSREAHDEMWHRKVLRSFASLRMTRMNLADFFAPVFHGLFYEGHELIGDGAVDEAVVVAEREVDDGADGDGIVAVWVGDDERHFRDTADAHDGGVGLVDDGQAEDGAELAGIGDGEG